MGSRICAGLALWTRWVLRLRYLCVLVSLLLVGLCLAYVGTGNLRVNTNTSDMFSDELDWRRDFLEYREAFDVRNRNIVAVVAAASDTQAVEFARELAAALRQEPEHFESVFLAGDDEFFDRNGLLYLPVEELEALSEQLIEAQPLIGLIGERGNGAGVIETLARIVSESDGTSAPPVERREALFVQAARALRSAAEGDARAIDWRALIGGQAPAIEQRLILVQPVLDPGRVRPARGAIDRLREISADLAVAAPGQPVVSLTGVVAMENEELDSVVRGASFAGIAALVLVTLVLLVTLRSIVLLVVSLVTLLCGVAGTAAFAALAIGQLNLLSVAFAVLYVGLGVDFILHVILRARELQRAGSSRDEAIVGSMRGVGSSLVICAVTTAAGFYAFIPTPFVGVSELGLISGTGMFISLLASVTILPALLGISLPAIAHKERARSRPEHGGNGLMRHARGTVIVSALVVVGAAALLPGVEFDSNPVRLRDPQAQSIATFQTLAESRDASFMSLVALTDDPPTAERWARELERLPEVAGVTTVNSLVPANQQEKLFILDDLSLVLGAGFGEFDRRPADPPALERALAQLREALAARAAASAGEAALLAALARWAQDERDAAAWRELDASLIGDLPQQLHRLDEGLSAESFSIEDLPVLLQRRWRSADGVELVEISPSGNINDSDEAGAFVDAVRSIVPRVTGLPVVYAEASATVVSAFRLALIYSLVFVSIILFAFMRRLKDCVLVLVPILCAAIVTAGATVALGLSFNFANVIALPLLVGVGVDSGIHMVHRMRTEPSGTGLLGTSTSRAVLASILTTIASFGNLAFSDHRGMSSMGVLLTLGMLVTLVATLVLLPALIRTLGAQRWTS